MSANDEYLQEITCFNLYATKKLIRYHDACAVPTLHVMPFLSLMPPLLRPLPPDRTDPPSSGPCKQGGSIKEKFTRISYLNVLSTNVKCLRKSIRYTANSSNLRIQKKQLDICLNGQCMHNMTMTMHNMTTYDCA